MLSWTELVAYLFVIFSMWGGGLGLCYMWLWRE